jgi:hypothetical protein
MMALGWHKRGRKEKGDKNSGGKLNIKFRCQYQVLLPNRIPSRA